MGQRPVSDLEKHISEPPQLAQSGIFHPLHERRIQEPGVRSRRSAYCPLPTVLRRPVEGLRPFALTQQAITSDTSVHTITIFVKDKMACTLQPTNQDKTSRLFPARRKKSQMRSVDLSEIVPARNKKFRGLPRLDTPLLAQEGARGWSSWLWCSASHRDRGSGCPLTPPTTARTEPYTGVP
jgi:hypothetical protein